MSIIVDYKKQVGTITFTSECTERTDYKIKIYDSNCLLAGVYNQQELVIFFVDEDHAKACLGLINGEDNIYGNRIKNITITEINKKTLKVAELFAKAGYKVIIHQK